MKLRTRFQLMMLLFGAILIAIVVFAVIGSRQLGSVAREANIANKVLNGLSELSYLEYDYILYRDQSQLQRWQTRHAAIMDEVLVMQGDNLEQETIMRNIHVDMLNLKDVFESVVLEPSSSNDNRQAMSLANIRASWSRMETLNIMAAADASRLLELRRIQIDQLRYERNVRLLVLFCLLIVYFLVNNLLVQRNVVKRIADLHAGTEEIGFGNLDTRIDEGNDELGELARSFNLMARNLKNLTATKAKLEAEMARLDRLNLIGQMAAGIGHEIRNPMTAVRGFLQMLGQNDRNADDKPYFDLMIEELDRANAIISEYLNMARNKLVKLEPTSLDTIVSALIPIIESDANMQDIDVKLELNSPPEVLADVNEIRQLILNMCRNGIEAMSAYGTLCLGTRQDKDQIVLYVKDEGPGIPGSIIDNVGTPFVTTKDNGTGLGLAVCYSIAARHDARIDFETGPLGTTFLVRFPAAS